MTEGIIVNGFDVSECYADNKMMKDGLYCFWEGGNCEDNEYCYYKECKRLEQENKELKGKYSHVLELAKTNADSNEYCLQGLEKKNENYRKALEAIKLILDTKCSIVSNAEAVGIINEVLNEG